MAASRYTIEITEAAWTDLNELDDFWTARVEAERGRQYVCDLLNFTRTELSDPLRARGGKRVRVAVIPDTREITAFGVYRLIYRIEEERCTVILLRYWHSHRDEPPVDV